MSLPRRGWRCLTMTLAGGLLLWWHRHPPTSPPPPKTLSCQESLLGRPLRVGIVEWPGYAGGIVANNGLKPNEGSIFYQKHSLCVQFVLLDDLDTSARAFALGGENGVDVVWSTVDSWAKELPELMKEDLKARVIMQVDWSRGGDAIVADNSIHRIEDLYHKKVSLALYTPSQWLFEYNLQQSRLNQI